MRYNRSVSRLNLRNEHLMDMTSPDQTKKVFLLGSLGLGALILVGLIWAVASGPGPTSNGSVSFDDANDPAIGSASSTVTVRVFGDFQCPACRAAEPGFNYAKNKYGDRVKFIWNDFPLQAIHLNALPAANAARCAEAQGKFWEYHDKLYSDQPTWSALASPTEKFLAYADALGLKQDDFAKCVSEKTYESKIIADLQEGTRNRVNSTPSFFINDTLIASVLENDRWDQEISARLGK